MIWADTPQLARTISQEQQSKVSIFRYCPRTVNLDGLDFCLHFGRWFCLPAGFQCLKGTSIMATSWAKVWSPVR